VRVVHVNFVLDAKRRSPDELLAAWPTFTGVIDAVVEAGVEVSVVIRSWHAHEHERRGVTYRFVKQVRRPVIPISTRRRRRGNGLLDTIRAAAPDLVHVHGLRFPLETRALAASLPHIPILAQDHGSRPPRRVRRPVYRWGLAPISAVAFVSHAQAVPFIETRILARDLPVFELVPGSSEFTPGDQTMARERTGVFGDPCFLCVGHLNDNKDPITVLRGFRAAIPQLPNPHLWCCFGTAPLRAAVDNMIARDPSLEQRVHLLGRRPHSEMEQYYRASDFLLSASHYEGSGFGVIESFACGTTPLVTDIPSFRKMTAEGTAGGLFEVGDVDGLSRLVLDWSSRDRMLLRRNARAHFVRALSYEVIGKDMRAVYERILRREPISRSLQG
jgi:glycosyltransferase involved in cell wall biosynthesis